MFRSLTVRRSALIGGVAALTLVAAGCGGDDSGDDTEGAGGGEDVSFEIGFTSAIGPGNVAILEAAEQLSKESGYGDIGNVPFSSTELAVQGLAGDDVQIMSGNGTEVYIAIDQGEPIQAVGQRIADEFVLVGGPDVAGCEDTDGKRMGIHSTAGITTALAKAWFLQECPDATPEYITIEGSDNRVQALIEGQLDMAIVDVGGVVALQRDAPDMLNVVDYMSQVFPSIQTSLNWANGAFIEDHPEAITDFLAKQIEVQRKMNEDPAYFAEVLQKFLPDMDAEAAELTASAYLDAGIFPTDGGVDAEGVQDTIDWLADNELGVEPDSITSDDVFDGSMLEAALEKVDS
jgi:ABC-type nitrate/sulfonate/bicarbonate transport system substrate-binding protein